MTENAFYYTLCVIPAIIAALAGLAVLMVYSRKDVLENYMLGEGHTTLERWGEYNNDRLEKPELQKNRLRDALARRNLVDVKGVLEPLNKVALELGKSKDKPDHRRGMNHIYTDKFLPAETTVNSIKACTKRIVLVSIVTTWTSVLPLAAGSVLVNDTVKIVPWDPAALWIVRLNVFLFSVFLLLLVDMVMLAFRPQPGYEIQPTC